MNHFKPGVNQMLNKHVCFLAVFLQALKEASTYSFEQKCTNDLRDVVDLVRGELTNLQRSTLGERGRALHAVVTPHMLAVTVQILKLGIATEVFSKLSLSLMIVFKYLAEACTFDRE